EPAINVDYPQKDATPGASHVCVRVTGVHLVTRLSIVINLPIGADARAMPHEQGHRYIAERCYSDAYRVAYYAASTVLNNDLWGSGATLQAARDNATTKISKEISDFYNPRVGELSIRINREYDRIGAHGTNQVPQEQAIRQAFAAFKR